MRFLLRLAAVSIAFAASAAHAQIAFRAASSALNEGVGIQHRGTGAPADGTGASITPGLPPRQAGDLLIAVIEARDLNTITVPNWTLLTNPVGTQGANHQAAIYWRIATNTAADTATISRVNTVPRDLIYAQISSFANVSTVSRFDGTYSFSPSAGATDNVATGPITTSNDCALLVASVHIADNNTFNNIAPGTWYQSFYSRTTTGSDAAIGLWYRNATAAGVQPSVTLTYNSPDLSHGAQFALQPGGLTVAVPAGTQAGDVMVATVASRPDNTTATNNNAKTVCAPAGWTLVRDTINNAGGGSGGTGLRLQTWTRVATASEPASYTWFFQMKNPSLVPGTGAGQYFASASAGIVSYSGVDNTTPLDVEGGNTTANSYSHTGNSIATTVANAMLVASHAFLSADTWTAPGGMTERVDQSAPASPPGNAVGIALEMSDEARPTAGATGPRTAVAGGTSNTDTGIVHMLALRPAVVTVHHYSIGVLSTSVANCDYAEVTITAHDIAHAAVNPPSTRTVALSTSVGTGVWQPTLVSGTGTWTPSGLNNGAATYQWPGTESSFTVRLRQSAVTSLSVNLADNASIPESVTEDPTISFAQSAFRISNGAGAALSVGTQIAGKPSDTGFGAQSLFLQAIRTDSSTGSCVSLFPNPSEVDIEVGAQCNNPAACARNVTLTTQSGTGTPSASFVPNGAYPATIRFRFNTANSEAPFYFSYADAGAITLQFRHALPAPPAATYVQGSSNQFVVRPFGIAFRGADVATAIQHSTTGAGALLGAAGDNFTMTLAAYQWAAGEDADSDGVPDNGVDITNNGTTPNFAWDATVTPSVNLPGTALGSLSRGVACASAATAATAQWSGGAATAGDWCYSEAGNVLLGASADNYLAAGITVPGSSGYDGTGTAGGHVGRFRPKRFALSVPSLTNRLLAGCAPASSFTYLDEGLGLGFTLTAQNTQGATTQNYAGAYAKLNVASFAALAVGARSGTTNLTSRVDSGSSSAGSWAAGVAAVTATTGIRRATPDNPDGPYAATQLGIAPVDSDGVQLAVYDLDVDNNTVNDHAVVGTTELRYGRLRLSNAVGSESLALPVPVQAQYWNGIDFVNNTLDSCTTVPRSAIALDFNPPSNLNACETAMSAASVTLAAGTGTITLNAPGAGNNGSVRLTVNLGSAGGSYCNPGSYVPAANGGLAYLLGRWSDAADPDANANTAHDDKPGARATFGLFGLQRNQVIYQRERY